MGNINRLPRGLLSILDSQVQGNNPTSLLEEVRPTIDMLDFYFQGKGTELTNNLNVLVGAGVTGTISPPAGEMWAIHHASVLLSPGDVLATTWFPAIYLLKNGAQIPLEVSDVGISTGAVTNTGSCVFYPARPLYLVGPDQGIQGVIERITGALPVLGVAANLRVVFNRILI